MTPDNDVKKNADSAESDPNTADDKDPVSAADVAEPSAPSGDEPANGADESAADLTQTPSAANAENDLAESEVDDLERAANAQSEHSSDDDPLGFGDQRMAGDEPDEHNDEIGAVRAELEASQAKLANHNDQLLRLQAEMENQRKRAQKDVTNAHKFALEKIALDLLPVKDSLEMGLAAATAEDADPQKIIEGSELTLKMLAQALEKYNIVEINPLDEKFDPEFHQAMTMQPVEGKEPNTVASVMQKGYTLNERLIRPALVMVAK